MESWLLICMSQVKSPWLTEVESSVMRQYRPEAAYPEMSRHDFSIVF